MECKCYLSSRERHFVLCTGWSSLSKDVASSTSGE